MGAVARLGALLVAGWFTFMAAMAAQAARRKPELPPLPDADADEIELGVAFEGLDYRSTASAFRGGTLECWFGGGSVDLRGATLHPVGATLEVKLIFGGASLLVPDDWTVTSKVSGIGGVGDARGAAPAGDEPGLTIVGTVLFGGLGVMTGDPRTGETAAV